MALADQIRQTAVDAGEIAIWYLAQAGFCFKTHAGTIVYLDPYLTDCVNRLCNFKRMIPTVITPEEVDAHLLLTTHAHPDHLDIDALPALASNPRTFFVGAPDCEETYRQHGIATERYAILREGEQYVTNDVTVRAIYADHGELAPDAMGFLLEIDGITIYNVGDSAYQPERILASLGTPVDVMIAPINGAFGNLDAREACQLAAQVKPTRLIAAHFWMFVEHGGDPAAFLAAGDDLLPRGTAQVMAPGEMARIRK